MGVNGFKLVWNCVWWWDWEAKSGTEIGQLLKWNWTASLYLSVVDPVTITRFKLLSISHRASHTKAKRNLADESATINFYCDRHSVRSTAAKYGLNASTSEIISRFRYHRSWNMRRISLCKHYRSNINRNPLFLSCAICIYNEIATQPPILV